MSDDAAGFEGAVYNTLAVVKRSGVPADTFRAWERRYGFPKPRRDRGGQRLYSERDIAAIRWLAEQTRSGVAVSRAVEALRRGFVEPARLEPPGPAAQTDAAPRSLSALRSELLNALLAFDGARAEQVLSEAFALHPVEDVGLALLQPLLAEVGERWASGSLSVADEHYASGFIRARLFTLLHLYSRPTAQPLIITACAPDEWHEMGVLLVSLFLVRAGYQVRYLGPNLPLAELASLIQRHRPAAVLLSAHGPATARHLLGADEGWSELASPPPRLLIGGQAFERDPRLRERLGATYAGPDARAALATVNRLLR